MTIKNAKNIYCLGIGGIGMSGVARLLKLSGKDVAGSDLKATAITHGLEEFGIKVRIGDNAVPGAPDLVIYSPAVPAADLEKIQIPKLDHGAAVGELMLEHYGIGVTGTNGKSTTTAMLGLILEAAELDPSVLIGSLLSAKNENPKFQANARFGQGKFFVAESDEYHRKMLENHPQMIVVTNIAEDHLDYYKNLEDIKAAFLEYVLGLPSDGLLIFNADDHVAVDVCRQAKCHKFTFGIHHYGDLQAINVETKPGSQSFDLHYDDEKIGTITLALPGHFNVSNALGASLAALKLGVPFATIKQSLENFAGLWRRFETVGSIDGKPIISDYAHHPAGVVGTIAAAQEFFPDQKILTVFQPHQRNRTKNLFKDFVDAMMKVPEVIIPEIFDVAGREHGEQISSKDLVNELNQAGERATYAKDLDTAEQLIRAKLNKYDIVLLMGAGDIDTLARKLAKN